MRRPEDPAQPATAVVADRAAAAEDFALSEACRSGDLAAYERLYQLHGARLKSFALNMLGNVHDAEDVVQEVFLKIHRSIRSFKGQSAFSTWIYRILINSCQDVRRKRMRRQETAVPTREADGPEPFEPPAPENDHPLRLALERCVAQLSPHLRRVFLLFEVEGFKHSEIATMLGISETSSKNAIYQAKQKLRRMLRETKSWEG